MVVELIPWSLGTHNKVFKDGYSLFLIAIDYFKSLLAISSTSQREVVLHSQDLRRSEKVSPFLPRWVQKGNGRETVVDGEIKSA